MCFICNDHNFIILFWFTNASLHECLMIWMLNELCNNTVDLSRYMVTYVIFTYAYLTGMIVWEDIWISLPLRWLFVYRLRLRQNIHKQVDILPLKSQVQHTANLLHLNLLLLYEYTWLNLRKADFHAHNSKTHFSPSNDSCTH